MRRLAALDVIEVEWDVFSLELVNFNKDRSEFDPTRGRSIHALRTAVTVGDEEGNDAVGFFYAALGTRVFDRAEPIKEPATARKALGDAGLDEELYDRALADDDTWVRVQEAHDAVIETFGAFGVPTICLNGGTGPAIFGPVISNPPDDDEGAVELWTHVRWLVLNENFAELKRDRRDPDLESTRQHRAREAAGGS